MPTSCHTACMHVYAEENCVVVVNHLVYYAFYAKSLYGVEAEPMAF